MSIAHNSRQVYHASDANFRKLVLESDVPVLVDFYADWCGPCKRLAPALEQLAKDNPGAKVVKVNVDDNPELAAKYRVESIPTLMVFKDGEAADKHVGLASTAQLRALLVR
jgi:thioredoxin 1